MAYILDKLPTTHIDWTLYRVSSRRAAVDFEISMLRGPALDTQPPCELAQSEVVATLNR